MCRWCITFDAVYSFPRIINKIACLNKTEYRVCCIMIFKCLSIMINIGGTRRGVGPNPGGGGGRGEGGGYSHFFHHT